MDELMWNIEVEFSVLRGQGFGGVDIVKILKKRFKTSLIIYK